MRIPLVLGLLLVGGVARADEVVAGTYDVKFEEMSNNCSNRLTFGRGDLKIDIKGNDLHIEIERVPVMNGQPSKGGKIKATSKKGHTAVEGMDGVFSVAGRVQGGAVQLVFVGEYSVKDKPLCTQSWNIAGARKDGK